MHREKAYAKAIELSKQFETDAVVYETSFGFGAILLEKYDGSPLDIRAQFCNGYIVE